MYSSTKIPESVKLKFSKAFKHATNIPVQKKLEEPEVKQQVDSAISSCIIDISRQMSFHEENGTSASILVSTNTSIPDVLVVATYKVDTSDMRVQVLSGYSLDLRANISKADLDKTQGYDIDNPSFVSNKLDYAPETSDSKLRKSKDSGSRALASTGGPKKVD